MFIFNPVTGYIRCSWVKEEILRRLEGRVIEDLEALSVLAPRNGKTESWPLVGGMRKF